jgi:hypothetical protein
MSQGKYERTEAIRTVQSEKMKATMSAKTEKEVAEAEAKRKASFEKNGTKRGRPNTAVVYDHVCKFCEQPFKDKRKTAKFCGSKCFGANRTSQVVEYAGKDDPDYWRDSHLRCTYGITLDDKTRMIEEQDGKCYICYKPVQGKTANVDHCHTTGKVRKILCTKCNFGLGHLNDDIELLQRCIDYIKEHA